MAGVGAARRPRRVWGRSQRRWPRRGDVDHEGAVIGSDHGGRVELVDHVDARSGSGVAAANGGTDDGGALGSAGDALLSSSTPGAVIEVDRSPSSSLSIRAAESNTDRAAVYILVLEGRYEDENVTGVAFQATAFAVFPHQIGGSLLGLQRDEFERAVVVHELGHLFGLVDLTGQGEFHEDPQHPGHSASKDSVMYWAVEDVSIRNLFRGGPPTAYDAADREEMARIRAG